MHGRNNRAGINKYCLLINKSLLKLSFGVGEFATSVGEQSLDGKKTIREKFSESFRVNPAILPSKT